MRPLDAEPLRMAEEEFIAFERVAEVRHEFVDGAVFTRQEASIREALIATNILTAVGLRIREGPCKALSSRVRVAVPGLHTYPNGTVVCGTPETHPSDRYAVTNPRVVFEVVSRATESYDRHTKFDHFCRCPSLAQYVLVWQRERRVLHYRRVENGWLYQEVGPDGTLALSALECEVPLAEIYRRAESVPSDEDE